MSVFRVLSTVLVSLALSLLVACSGGETGTGVTDDSQQTTIGTITGFGSVHVNGVRFVTDTSTNVQINNTDGTEADLAHGMVVAIKGTVDASGTTGMATEIRYGHSMVGIVFENTLANATPGTTMDVMGYSINVGTETVFENSDTDNPAINTLAAIPAGAVVEISGFRLISGDGVYATRIEHKNIDYNTSPGASLYVKGVIDTVDDTNIRLLGSSLAIDHRTSSFEDGVLPLLPNKIVSIELASDNPRVPPVVDDTYRAIKIETFVPDEDDLDDGDEVEIEGVVTGTYQINTGIFSLNGLNILVGGDVEFDCSTPSDITQIQVGMKLEVGGVFNASKVLVAEEVECRHDASVEIMAYVHSIDLNNNTFSVLGQPVTVNDLTIMKDESDSPEKEFDLMKLMLSDQVEVHAYVAGANMIATRVIRLSNDPNESTFSFSAPISSVNVDPNDVTKADAITAAGIEFDVSQLNPKISSDIIGDTVDVIGTYNSTSNEITVLDAQL